MPPATPLRDHSDRALEHDVLDHGVGAQNEELTRFGPDAAGAKILMNNQSRSPHLTSTSTTFSRISTRHYASDSIATSSSLASSDESDAERIELSALRPLEPAGRGQAFADGTVGRGRFESIASASSSSSASTSELDRIQKGAIGDRSAVPSFLERVDDTPGIARSENCYNLDSVPHFEGASSDQNTPPLIPMSPRSSRYPHRIYVPSNSHHDDERKFKNSLSEVDLEAASPSISARSPDIDLVAAETDSLLPLQKAASSSHRELPAPASAPRSDNCDEPRTFRFSFTRVETSIHVLGILTILLLVILSVWLTLANVVM